MGGFFGIVSKCDCMMDVFFGTDYHSHLGTRRGGMAAWGREIGLQRKIHNIENSPFRTKFNNIFDEMKGTSAIGCISDTDPQPMLIRSRIGTYALVDDYGYGSRRAHRGESLGVVQGWRNSCGHGL